jgi:hypothetical protein
VEDDQEGLDRAMEHLWPAYQRHTRWEVLESSNSRWLRCETAPVDDSSRQIIHLDMLTARLLVDGKPLTRLPDCFLRHPSYIALFGHVSFLPCSSASCLISLSSKCLMFSLRRFPVWNLLLRPLYIALK